MSDAADNSVDVDAKQRIITVTKVFDAPLEQVWQAHIDPKLVVQWWGPKDRQQTVQQFDVRSGGHWRIEQIDAVGARHYFSGKYQEVILHQKLVRTLIYEAVPENVIHETIQFTALSPDHTEVTVVSMFPTSQALNGALQNRFSESYNRIEGVFQNE